MGHAAGGIGIGAGGRSEVDVVRAGEGKVIFVVRVNVVAFVCALTARKTPAFLRESRLPSWWETSRPVEEQCNARPKCAEMEALRSGSHVSQNSVNCSYTIG